MNCYTAQEIRNSIILYLLQQDLLIRGLCCSSIFYYTDGCALSFIPAGGIQKFPASPALASQGNELIKLILNVEMQNQYS